MKKALIVRGGWEDHEPWQTTDVFIPILKGAGFEVEVSETLDAFLDKARLNTLNLIVPCWSVEAIDSPYDEFLLEAVRNGVGIAGWHGGLSNFRNSRQYQFMVGGSWIVHPGDIIDYEVKITNPEDPIMAGLKDFKLKSEQYYMHVDPSNEVLATTTFSGDYYKWIEGNTMPVVWKRHYGKGRVFYASFGHTAEDFKIPETVEIVKRGMLWAAR